MLELSDLGGWEDDLACFPLVNHDFGMIFVFFFPGALSKSRLEDGIMFKEENDSFLLLLKPQC